MGYSAADTDAGSAANFDDDEVSDYFHVLNRVSVSALFRWENIRRHTLISMDVTESPVLAFTAW